MKLTTMISLTDVTNSSTAITWFSSVVASMSETVALATAGTKSSEKLPLTAAAVSLQSVQTRISVMLAATSAARAEASASARPMPFSITVPWPATPDREHVVEQEVSCDLPTGKGIQLNYSMIFWVLAIQRCVRLKYGAFALPTGRASRKLTGKGCVYSGPGRSQAGCLRIRTHMPKKRDWPRGVTALAILATQHLQPPLVGHVDAFLVRSLTGIRDTQALSARQIVCLHENTGRLPWTGANRQVTYATHGARAVLAPEREQQRHCAVQS